MKTGEHNEHGPWRDEAVLDKHALMIEQQHIADGCVADSDLAGRPYLLAAIFSFVILSAALLLQSPAPQTVPDKSVPAASEVAGTQPQPAAFKDRVCTYAGVLCGPLKQLYYSIIKHFGIKHWLPFLSAFGCAYLLFLAVGMRSGSAGLLSGLKYLFPRKIFLHRSAVLDYKFYVARLFVSPFVTLFAALFPATAIAAVVSMGMTSVLGPVSFFEPGLVSGLVYTVGLLLVVDFGFFFAHYLSHKLPFLWEFHKVHHAAEVLTPVTVRRMHPMDSITGFAAFGITAGTFNGLYSWAGHGGLDPVIIPGTVAILFVFRLTSVLKHSHIWLNYGWFFSHIFNSPAQHQLHHSIELRHRDCNFGRAFSLWDWMFGTIYIPEKRETFAMGLDDEEHLKFRSVADCYLRPIVQAARMLGDRKVKDN